MGRNVEKMSNIKSDLRTLERSPQFEEHALLVPAAAMENQFDQSTIQRIVLGIALFWNLEKIRE